MTDKYHRQWERLGESDPYWAVIAQPAKKGGKWNPDEFFRTGENEITRVFRKLKRLNVDVTLETALDFGCGVGRLSRPLARKFQKVVAIDTANSMLDEARQANQAFGNIDFRQNKAEHLKIISSNSVNFLYSNIVLQHLPRHRQVKYIREFCRVLGPGGVLVFQTPSGYNLKTGMGWLHLLAGNGLLNLARRIKHGPKGIMEIHTLPQKRVQKILHHEGLHLVQAERYNPTGHCFRSFRYYAVKPARL